jgi:CRP/FNR family transcriptional regulator, cyclic AMP receptor protein
MSSIFERLPADQVDRVKAAGRHVTLPEGWSPIGERTSADKAYILLKGEVSVRRGGEEIARLGEGELFGEQAIVNHTLRTATIVALSPLELLHYTSEDLERLVADVPGLRDAIDASAAERLGEG